VLEDTIHHIFWVNGSGSMGGSMGVNFRSLRQIWVCCKRGLHATHSTPRWSVSSFRRPARQAFRWALEGVRSHSYQSECSPNGLISAGWIVIRFEMPFIMSFGWIGGLMRGSSLLMCSECKLVVACFPVRPTDFACVRPIQAWKSCAGG
jgi:hypothetical protein